MINIPVDTGASLSTGGIEIHAWVGDHEGDPAFYSWSTLVNELIEGYTIPNHRGKTLINSEDYDYLVEVLQDIQGAAGMLLQRLDDAEVV